MPERVTVRQQISNNLVAIISMVVAVSSLLYSAWRHEVTEDQRTVRQAGFEILRNLGELQTIADHAHYGDDPLQGNPVSGWGRVLMVRDLSRLMPEPAQIHTVNLHKTWEAEWAGLGENPASSERITAAINACREQTALSIASLD
ncbi:MAG: hypothetical protein Q8K57_10680 [Thiobacillus sp.]|nr:hypothetical protein [Thiobacillus sp.]MDP1925233.1 hypothetical protein [Thiobacillus sp.]